MLTIIALHLLIILWLASNRATGGGWRAAAPDRLTVLSLSVPGAAAPPAERNAAPPATPVLPPSAPDPAESAYAAPSSGGVVARLGADAATGGCALARNVGEAIGKDPSAMAELDALPTEVRTSADAVMLWNGQWPDQGAMPGTVAIGSLRRAVAQVVADAPAECRGATATGPQFIPVPDGNRTLMIVIGSGSWRWADLIASPAECARSPGCPTEDLDKNDQSIGERQ